MRFQTGISVQIKNPRQRHHLYVVTKDLAIKNRIFSGYGTPSEEKFPGGSMYGSESKGLKFHLAYDEADVHFGIHLSTAGVVKRAEELYDKTWPILRSTWTRQRKFRIFQVFRFKPDIQISESQLVGEANPMASITGLQDLHYRALAFSATFREVHYDVAITLESKGKSEIVLFYTKVASSPPTSRPETLFDQMRDASQHIVSKLGGVP